MKQSRDSPSILQVLTHVVSPLGPLAAPIPQSTLPASHRLHRSRNIYASQLTVQPQPFPIEVTTKTISHMATPSGSGSYAYTTMRDDPTTVTMPVSSFFAGLSGVLVPDDRELSAGGIGGMQCKWHIVVPADTVAVTKGHCRKRGTAWIHV